LCAFLRGYLAPFFLGAPVALLQNLHTSQDIGLIKPLQELKNIRKIKEMTSSAINPRQWPSGS
jgi:hypothetical protein